MSVGSRKTAILYQNDTQTITLMDIPKSISLGQGTSHQSGDEIIYSSSPLKAPYESTEPKSIKARANVLQMRRATDVGFPEDLLNQAIERIAEAWKGEWCLERMISPLTKVQEPKDHKSAKMFAQKFANKPENSMANVSKEPDLIVVGEKSDSWHNLEPLILRQESTTFTTPRSLTNRLVQNHLSLPLLLHISCLFTTYHLPPQSSFLLSKINTATTTCLSMAALSALPSSTPTAGPGQFDFILLDPPWENRSVRRSGKYQTIKDSGDPMDGLRPMLEQHVAPGGLVACWITNKASIREDVLESFDAWDVKLIEEWAWLKVTVDGRPMTEIGGVWRKPYEVLLIGRKRGAKRGRQDESNEQRNVMRRVIVAVSDIHSRKPSLKELVEPMMQCSNGYRALEIFARHLTAGWWAWGDDVLKFNWEGHWGKRDGSSFVWRD